MRGLAYVFQTAPGLYRPQTFVSGSALNFTRNYHNVRSMTTQYLQSLVRCGCAIIIVLRIRQQFFVLCARGREYSTSWGCGLVGLAIKRVFLLYFCYFQWPQLCKASGPAPRPLEFESQVDNKNFVHSLVPLVPRYIGREKRTSSRSVLCDDSVNLLNMIL